MPDAASSRPVRKRSRLWYLEALRGIAALHVMLNHVFNSYLNVKHAFWNSPFRFGQEGVLIFFLLSGFVICYSHGTRDADPGGFKTYLFKRGRRIYPIFILSLGFAFVIQCVGSYCPGPTDFRSLAGNLFMLQDSPNRPGVFVRPFADNNPLWSLSYEWWFYMMFYPINRWVPVSRQKYLVLGLSVAGMVAGKIIPNSVFNFLVFFLIWWAGVEMAREFLATGNVTFIRQGKMLALLLVPVLWYGVQVWQRKAAGIPISYLHFPFMGFRYFAMAILFILLMFGWKLLNFAGFRQTIGQFEWAGSISYALYLFHYPLICDLRLFPGSAPAIFYTDLCLRIAIAFALAWLAERRLQKWINSATERWAVGKRKKAE